MPSLTICTRGASVCTCWMICDNWSPTCCMSAMPRRTSSENLSMPITPADTDDWISRTICSMSYVATAV
ncbi:hypothetical protein D3C73_1378600 [compost metagenome]